MLRSLFTENFQVFLQKPTRFCGLLTHESSLANASLAKPSLANSSYCKLPFTCKLLIEQRIPGLAEEFPIEVRLKFELWSFQKQSPFPLLKSSALLTCFTYSLPDEMLDIPLSFPHSPCPLGIRWIVASLVLKLPDKSKSPGKAKPQTCCLQTAHSSSNFSVAVSFK